MLDYHRLGKLPAKHHIAFRRPSDNHLYQEHCVTRAGFERAFSILYHVNPPTRELATMNSPYDGGPMIPHVMPNHELDHPLRRRHLNTNLVEPGGTLLGSRRAVMFNDDIAIHVARPTENSADFFANGDGDDLYFFFKGSGRLESMFGRLDFGPDDYVIVPRSCIHRFVFDPGEVFCLIFEGYKDIQIPQPFRNESGQLRLEAPYCARDFRRPEKLMIPENDRLPAAPDSSGWKVVVKKFNRISEHLYEHYPCDVVGWDGYVYPVAFNIMNYQPKAGLVHLPPNSHTTFSSMTHHGGGIDYVVCSFVPRNVDFHPQAIPCPYNHSSPDCDEILFYVRGNFVSRKGIMPGSVSLHPTGIPHGPHPGAYEGSIGHKRTEELAVMCDTYKPLHLTKAGAEIEVSGYHETWTGASLAKAISGAEGAVIPH